MEWGRGGGEEVGEEVVEWLSGGVAVSDHGCLSVGVPCGAVQGVTTKRP